MTGYKDCLREQGRHEPQPRRRSAYSQKWTFGAANRGLLAFSIPSYCLAHETPTTGHSMATNGPVLRVFEVQTKQGCVEKFIDSFATTSADVVQGASGNKGYFYGRCVQGGDNVVVFVSVWRDLAAIKTKFGNDWQSSYLPPGYEDLIDTCSVRHFDIGLGWHADDLSDGEGA
jgi:quinol monooxygenase YgiN